LIKSGIDSNSLFLVFISKLASRILDFKTEVIYVSSLNFSFEFFLEVLMNGVNESVNENLPFHLIIELDDFPFEILGDNRAKRISDVQ
jgi:hypothetical protein